MWKREIFTREILECKIYLIWCARMTKSYKHFAQDAEETCVAHPLSNARCKGNSNKIARCKENVLKLVMARDCGVLTLFCVDMRRVLVCEKGRTSF